MKKIIYSFAFIGLLLLCGQISYSQPKAAPPIPYMLENACMGTDFWVAIPQNEDPMNALRNPVIEIVVSSNYNTSVNLEVPDLGIARTKPIKAYDYVSFSTKEGDLQTLLEISEGDQVTNKGIHLTSEKPISVYVINCKEYSADGYMAMPVSSWGPEYYHCAYYDFFESSGEKGKRGGGFICLAAENGTKLTIKLNGIGGSVGKCDNEKKIGTTYTLSLDKGQTYMIKGDGTTKGQFDISGTHILGNKPFGCVAFHMRTMIPSECADDRDNLMESLAPVSQWGKQFISVQFNRIKGTVNQGDGDLFRIVSSEDNTKVHCDFYDLKTNVKISQRDILLNKAGSFFELDNITNISANNQLTSIRGAGVWTADKPVMMMQYAFSNRWDDDMRWAPIQVMVTPVEQYVSSFVFETAVVSDFNQNVLTLYAYGNPEDPQKELIKSVALDGEEIWRKEPSLLSNVIPGTNIYWVRTIVGPGAHRIESKTKLSGNVCGLSLSNCYGYNVGQGTSVLNKYDVAPPKITVNGSCGNYTIEATEIFNGPEGSNPHQEDQGISRIFLIDSGSSNYKLTLKDPDKFLPQYKLARQTFYLNPINRALPGIAKFGVLDKAGNYLIDSVKFIPDSIKLQTLSLDFGNVRVSKPKISDLKISNIGSGIMTISKMKLKNNINFEFVNKSLENGFSIPPFSDTTIQIIYTPKSETKQNQDEDSLLITGQCSSFSVYLQGKGIAPHIQSYDFDFGKTEVQKEVCIDDNSSGLKIDNPGTDTLIVTAIDNISSPFLISNATPAFPFPIPPGSNVFFKSICFFASDSGKYSMDAIIRSDAAEGDSIIKLSATAFKKADTINSVEQKPEFSNYLEIYPNPANDEIVNIMFYTDGLSSMNVELYDLEGRLCLEIDSGLKESGIYQKYFSTSTLGSGIYYIKMANGSMTLVKRLVIIK